jgi:hypothetical protein
MEFEYFWDTPPKNLLSRLISGLKHRTMDTKNYNTVLYLTYQIIGIFYSPGGDLKNIRYIFGIFK